MLDMIISMMIQLFGGNFGFSIGLISIEFLIGLILGLLIKKALKTIIVIAILIGLGSYFSIVIVNWDKIAGTANVAIALSSFIFTLLPLGAGLLVGGLIGFTKG